ncbi:MAG: Mitochondrial inner membrane organizing system component [Piccolia ochrophora]|nr:MAG: Mitochondrial inner membrane organizing system component [Piccolia ochrophora]
MANAPSSSPSSSTPNSAPPPPTTSPTLRLPSSKPASEALLNDKWDTCLSSIAIRSTLGLSFGIVFSVLLFKRRAWPAWVGLGFGAGRAWEECDSGFKRAGGAGVGKEGLRVVR